MHCGVMVTGYNQGDWERLLKGDYDRHHFSYVVPASEPGAGGTVAMVLLSEILMHLKPPTGEEQTWRRCGKPIS